MRGPDEVSDVSLPALAERQEGLMEHRGGGGGGLCQEGWKSLRLEGWGIDSNYFPGPRSGVGQGSAS